MGAAPEYLIHLPQFEGPFDLLLFFIERDELDVRDIPVARVTADFLVYLRQAEAQALTLGPDFTLMAAQLMRIKAAMLLPRPVLGPEGEVIDPRQELVAQLLAYQQFRHAAEQMEGLAEARAASHHRPLAATQLDSLQETLADPTDELVGVTLFKLLQAYQAALARGTRAHAQPRHVIQPLPYNMDETRAWLLAELQGVSRRSFIDLVQLRPDRLFVVFMLLAVLELVQHQQLKVLASGEANQLWLVPVEETSGAPNSQEVNGVMRKI